MTDLFKDLEYRGLIKQVTDPGLKAELAKGPLTLYCGFDPTADSLHLGSLLPLLTLRRFQQAGHRVIAVVGGATGQIGDPSFKAQERNLLTLETIAQNLKGITHDISKFLALSGSNAAAVVNNADWFQGLGYLEFLRDVGKHFTVNTMMAKESVRARLEDREHGISYTEFSYMLVQAYDFFVLNRDRGCRLQLGGSDQWGNITAGCELIRRHAAATGIAAREVYGLTFPLVTKKDGGKFGKSESGNIWLNPNKTSPYQFYQFLLQTADDDVITYLKYFTFLTPAEITQLEHATREAPEKRAAQTRLAEELTRLVHGEEELKKAQGATGALFTDDLSGLSAEALATAFQDAPATQKSKSALAAGLSLVDLVAETGLCASKGAARKDIQAGGIYVNNQRVTDVATTLTAQNLLAGTFIVLRKGKKTYHLVRFT